MVTGFEVTKGVWAETMKKMLWVDTVKAFIVGGGLLLGTSASASDELVEMMIRLDSLFGNPAAMDAAANKGAGKAALCAACHGSDGNSLKPEIPNLAGQNTSYILEQLVKFSDGRRKEPVMQSMTEQLTVDEKVNIALYFTKQEVKASGKPNMLSDNGKPLFQKACVECHGHDGRGEVGYARLAGQQAKYLEITLKRFRDLALGTQVRSDSKRTSQRMEEATKLLSDMDIKALAAYIAQLK